MAPWHHVGATMEITLDKNGSLYDPAGTESWNMQIRYEKTKLTKHPTNNRSSPEWFPWPRSSSKNKWMNRRRGCDKIIQIHRRHGFGELIQGVKNTVGDMVSAKTEEGSDASKPNVKDQK